MINLPDSQLIIVKTILNQYIPNAEVWVFGSRVTTQYKPFSDLDLLIRRADDLDQKRLFKIMDAFEESDLPIKVDVLDWSTIETDFQAIILKNYQVLEF